MFDVADWSSDKFQDNFMHRSAGKFTRKHIFLLGNILQSMLLRATAYMPRQFRLSVLLLSVHPSVTRVICIKTAKRIIEILSRSDRPIILVFRDLGSLRNLTASPTRGRRIQGG